MLRRTIVMNGAIEADQLGVGVNKNHQRTQSLVQNHFQSTRREQERHKQTLKMDAESIKVDPKLPNIMATHRKPMLLAYDAWQLCESS